MECSQGESMSYDQASEALRALVCAFSADECTAETRQLLVAAEACAEMLLDSLSAPHSFQLEMKKLAPALWTGLSRRQKGMEPLLVARVRDVSALMFHAAAGHGGARNAHEVARAWLRSAADFVIAGAFGEAEERCSRGLRRLAAVEPDTLQSDMQQRLGFVTAQLHVTAAKAMLGAGRSDDALSYSLQAGAGMWSDDGTEAAETVIGAAEAALRAKRARHAAQWARLALDHIVGGTAHKAALLRALAQSQHQLGDHAQALTTVQAANAEHSDSAGLYQACIFAASAGKERDADRAAEQLLSSGGGADPALVLDLVQNLSDAGLRALAGKVLGRAAEATKGSAAIEAALFESVAEAAPVDELQRARAFDMLGVFAERWKGVPAAAGDVFRVYASAHRCGLRLSVAGVGGPDDVAAARTAAQWFERVVPLVPPTATKDRAKVLRALSDVLQRSGDSSLAVQQAAEARRLDPTSLDGHLRVFQLAVAAGDTAAAAAALEELPDRADDGAAGAVSPADVAALAAEHAHARGYRLLCAEAIKVSLAKAGCGLSATVRLQLLANCMLCQGDEADDHKRAAEAVSLAEAALAVLRSPDTEMLENEAAWWQARAFDTGARAGVDPVLAARSFRASADLCILLKSPAAARACVVSLLQHSATCVEMGGRSNAQSARRSVEEALQQLGSACCDLRSGNGQDSDETAAAFALSVKPHLLCVDVTACLLSGEPAQVTLSKLQQLARLPLVSHSQLSAIANVAAPGQDSHCAEVYAEAMRLAVDRARTIDTPATETRLRPLAQLLCRAAGSADGRDDQLPHVRCALSAAKEWTAVFPAAELEWLAAEAWGNALYYRRMLSPKASEWASLARDLAACMRTESDHVGAEILAQHQVFFNAGA
eukprot:TRINITY_DN6078_c1_g1_i1.p1 TRINITY_DN6078_c1_g1~~TRINITY_DN6078_c1_g1_i1.p1  ORF type:complete len:902 (+),score=240.40 TRINITY_DN6078_c1_g1_i1:44-2707(+)